MGCSLEQQVGQLLWCGWGAEPEADPRRVNDHARVLVEELQVGGLVLFSRNVARPLRGASSEKERPIPTAAPAAARDPDEVAALTGELRRRAARPPLIGIDQEGGRVCRLLCPGMVFPGSMALGVVDDLRLTRDVHRAIGEQLAALGIDVDFAPVLDVNNNPLNPIIGVRSFGGDPGLVSRHGVAAIQGLRDAGVLPVVKHFPGHGDTSADSHLELPVQPSARPRLDAVELAPFRAALAAGAPAVMTTHILFPALDPELPATLSRRILTGLLRGELGFDGLIVTDCMEMQGLGRRPPEEAALLAITAGADMLVVCHTLATQRRMHAALCDAVRTGRLPEERVLQSVRRVEQARELTRPVRERPRDPSVVSAARFRELEERSTEAGLRLFGSASLDRPFTREAPLLAAGPGEPAADLAAELRRAGFDARSTAWSDAASGAAQLVWLALPREPAPDGRPSEAALENLRRHPKAVVVATCEPYCLAYYPASVPRLAAWGFHAPHRQAVVRWLEGALRGVPHVDHF